MFVSVGNSRMDKKFNGQEMSYEDFAKRLSQTTYTAETMEQYRKMPKGQQDDVKDVGGFVLGKLKGGRRKKDCVLSRSAVTLDMDYGTEGIKSTVTSIVNGIKNTVTSAFQNILSGIKGTMGNIVTTIKDGFNQAISFITSLPSKALQWGKDIIMGIVNGIRSCIGAVGDAVASVAEKIKSFLHFSVPDEGPLTEYESWMPDFMKGLAKGIEGSRGLIEKAVRGVSEDMVISPRLASSAADMESSAGAVSGSSLAGLTSAITAAIRDMNGQTGDIVIPVYLGGAMLDEIVVSAQQRTNLRSGGR